MTSTKETTMFDLIVQKTLRVPRSVGAPGNGAVVARQMDAALLGVGFKMSRELLEHVAGLEPGAGIDLAVETFAAVQKLVGAHVRHNSYFINFPHDVPDTMEFWVSCLRKALVPAGGRGRGKASDAELREILSRPGFNLLTLPTYGSYQHTFEDLLAAHEELIEGARDRVTVLHLGDSLYEEQAVLFDRLLSSKTPLTEGDLELLRALAQIEPAFVVPAAIPVRENRALLNAAYLETGRQLVFVDTVVDVLRTAVAASGGDVSLQTPSKLRNFRRPERRALLAALHRLIGANRAKLGDVARLGEQFKRLEKALHPRDYRLLYPGALAVFEVARGDYSVPSLAAKFEARMREGDPVSAADVLTPAPGHLLRSLDHLLRACSAPDQVEVVVELATVAMKSASGRVLLSLREHLVNRDTPDVGRVFVGRSKKVWVTSDERPPLDDKAVSLLTSAIDAEIRSRMPRVERLVVDYDVLGVALPLSGKAVEDGFAVLPRGSREQLPAGDTLRFFVYWRQTSQRTDYDLSALLLDKDFREVGQVSFTNYHLSGVVHSGDLTSAPDGATEFIDVQLPLVNDRVRYIVPQVNIYSGEDFTEVAESLFGWMVRDSSAKGMPFEPRTVRMRSEMRGSGRVALPVLFVRTGGSWEAVWSQLYLNGRVNFNQVEANRLTTGMLARSIVDRTYLSMAYLLSALSANAGEVLQWEPDMELEGPVTFVGRTAPEGLPEGSEIFSADRLAELIPG